MTACAIFRRNSTHSWTKYHSATPCVQCICGICLTC